MADTTGHLPFFVVTAAIGAVVGAVAGGVVAAKNGGNVWAGIGIGAAAGGLIGAGAGAAAGALLGVGVSASTPVVLGTASVKLAATGTTLGVGASKVIDKIANGYEKARSVITGSTNIYRSIGNAEMLDIQKTNQFNLPTNGLEAKQFTFSYSEALTFGQNYNQNIIAKASVPNDFLLTLDPTKVDAFLFKSGTLTVWEGQLNQFNQAVAGTIQILP